MREKKESARIASSERQKNESEYPPSVAQGAGSDKCERVMAMYAPAPTARVTEHRALNSGGAATDIITLELPSGMVLHGCLVCAKDGKRWVNPPNKVRVWHGEIQHGLDRRPMYDPVVTFSDRARSDAFSALALAALDAYLSTQEAR